MPPYQVANVGPPILLLLRVVSVRRLLNTDNSE